MQPPILETFISLKEEAALKCTTRVKKFAFNVALYMTVNKSAMHFAVNDDRFLQLCDKLFFKIDDF